MFPSRRWSPRFGSSRTCDCHHWLKRFGARGVSSRPQLIETTWRTRPGRNYLAEKVDDSNHKKVAVQILVVSTSKAPHTRATVYIKSAVHQCHEDLIPSILIAPSSAHRAMLRRQRESPRRSRNSRKILQRPPDGRGSFDGSKHTAEIGHREVRLENEILSDRLVASVCTKCCRYLRRKVFGKSHRFHDSMLF